MKNLFDLMPGETGIIKKIGMGKNLYNKISCLNIREEKEITKITQQPLNGPCVIKIDNCQVALGKGIALKILVEQL